MKHYTENDLERDLSAMQEEAPPMPEHLHAAWTARVAATPQTDAVSRKIPPYRQFLRGIAAAAAVVFVAAGATLAADRVPVNAPQKEAAYDTAENGSVMYSRAMGGMTEETAYDGGVMLTSDMAVGEPSSQERKVIRSVSLTITTEAFPSALDNLKNTASSNGGWIESITESGEDGDRRAWLTLRIPAEALDVFLESAGSAGRVTNRSESAQDVTNPYYDTQARLESQQLLLNRLQELVAQAESLEDILALETQIADTQYEIDRLNETLVQTDRQVDYATVDITLRETTSADQAADAQLSLGQRVIAALKTGGEVFADFMENAVIWLVSAVPFAAVVAALWLLTRLFRRKRK